MEPIQYFWSFTLLFYEPLPIPLYLYEDGTRITCNIQDADVPSHSDVFCFIFFPLFKSLAGQVVSLKTLTNSAGLPYPHTLFLRYNAHLRTGVQDYFPPRTSRCIYLYFTCHFYHLGAQHWIFLCSSSQSALAFAENITAVSPVKPAPPCSFVDHLGTHLTIRALP